MVRNCYADTTTYRHMRKSVWVKSRKSIRFKYKSTIASIKKIADIHIKNISHKGFYVGDGTSQIDQMA
jgi:hypothetical protein